MKKVNTRIVAVAFLLLALLAGGLTAKDAIAPGGFKPDPNGSGG